jgi:nickel-dependent lactate racemase
MVDAMKVLKDINVFSIQTVLTGDHQLYAVTAGDLLQSFDAAIEHANTIFCVPLKQKGNIVISAAPYPMDIDLYQSQKAMDNGKHALDENGILILVSKCRMGVGEESFLDLLSQACTPKEVFSIIKQEYKLGFHKAAKMAQIGMNHQLWAVTDLDEKIIQKAMMKPFHDLQHAIDEAVQEIQNRGETPRTIVMPQGSLTIPQYVGG